jgi:hypothetical protein
MDRHRNLLPDWFTDWVPKLRPDGPERSTKLPETMPQKKLPKHLGQTKISSDATAGKEMEEKR